MNNLLRMEESGARIVLDDPWTLIRSPETADSTEMLILPLAHWLESPSTHAVWLGPDDGVEGDAEEPGTPESYAGVTTIT